MPAQRDQEATVAPTALSTRALRERLPAQSGVYVLTLALSQSARIEVGRLGSRRFEAGYYLYVGSAFGSGGLRARVSRHWAGTGRHHWHLDYLRDVAQPLAAWVQVQLQSREHRWSVVLARGRGLQPVPDFGCTDCACAAHLYYSSSMPSFQRFRRRLGRLAEGDGPLLQF